MSSSHSYSFGTSLTVGSSVTVSAGIPEVDSVEGEFHWEVGVTADTSSETSEEHTTTFNYPLTVPPNTCLCVTVT